MSTIIQLHHYRKTGTKLEITFGEFVTMLNMELEENPSYSNLPVATFDQFSDPYEAPCTVGAFTVCTDGEGETERVIIGLNVEEIPEEE